jgi:hypothetical protein
MEQNFRVPGNFPTYFQISSEIGVGEFKRTFKRHNSYGDYADEDDVVETTYDMTFGYCFEFSYRNKIAGTAFVYRGGFYIEYAKPGGGTYLSSHCNHFSMPMSQHYTDEGKFTQFFIDRIAKVLETDYEYRVKDETDTSIHYLNQRKGH